MTDYMASICVLVSRTNPNLSMRRHPHTETTVFCPWANLTEEYSGNGQVEDSPPALGNPSCIRRERTPRPTRHPLQENSKLNICAEFVDKIFPGSASKLCIPYSSWSLGRQLCITISW